MAFTVKSCSHLKAVDFEASLPTDYECAECIKTGAEWVHLRKCTDCGVVLCCDSSTNKHARKHFHASEHPVIISAEPNERWAWCYVDELYLKY
ncbi:MAG: UBP-type zinc finger domain-containing protein [Bacteroidia bacterium]